MDADKGPMKQLPNVDTLLEGTAWPGLQAEVRELITALETSQAELKRLRKIMVERLKDELATVLKERNDLQIEVERLKKR